MTNSHQQPIVSSKNPFALLQLPENFALDDAVLHTAYTQRLKQFHPDLFVTRTAKEQLMATHIAADIVVAYQLLRDPVKRGEWLLNAAGFPFSLENTTIVDLTLLEEQMEYRERLSNSDAKDQEALHKTLVDEYDKTLTAFAKALQDKSLSDASQQLLRLRFLQKLLEALD